MHIAQTVSLAIVVVAALAVQASPRVLAADAPGGPFQGDPFRVNPSHLSSTGLASPKVPSPK